MKIAIEASNIRSGGGLIHLKEIISRCDYENLGIKKIILFSNKKTLSYFDDNNIFLKKQSHWLLNISYFGSLLYQKFYLNRILKKEKCDVLLIPGGITLCDFKPMISISQNMLPFNLKEAFRFSSILVKLKFILIFLLQKYTFSRSRSVIFLSEYAKRTIEKSIKKKIDSKIIPHGYDIEKFEILKKIKRNKNELKLLYVSNFEPYKHQSNIVDAVCQLNLIGYNIELTLIGKTSSNELEKINKIFKKYEEVKKFIKIKGFVKHDSIERYYKVNHAFIFASTCENDPIILKEAISSGIPILCSNYPPMNELFKENYPFFFDPLIILDIKRVIKKIYKSNTLNFSNSITFESRSWNKVSNETFRFIIISFCKKK